MPLEDKHQETDYKRQTSLPLEHLSAHQETDYTQTQQYKPSPGTLFRVHQGTVYTYYETDKSSPGTLLRVSQRTDYIKTKAIPWNPFRSIPRDRLHEEHPVREPQTKQHLALHSSYMYTMGSC